MAVSIENGPTVVMLCSEGLDRFNAIEPSQQVALGVVLNHFFHHTRLSCTIDRVVRFSVGESAPPFRSSATYRQPSTVRATSSIASSMLSSNWTRRCFQLSH